MNIFVISDIHGSESALNKALEIYSAGKFDKMILCGDILYHGARNPLPDGYNPAGVIALLNNLKGEIIAVRGNCESEVDQMVLEFPITGDYSYLNIDKRMLFLTHGHLFSSENLPPLNGGDIFISGHTHIPKAEIKNNIYFLNPGSIALPKGDFPPSYGILANGVFEVKELCSSRIILSLDI